MRIAPSIYASVSMGEGWVGVILMFRCALRGHEG